jgi:deoxyhypusine synthase
MIIEDMDADWLVALDAERAFSGCGFQATNLARGISIIRDMKKKNATVFLTFTSNLVASGLRGVIAELCRRKFVDAVITAGGSLDHDLIKSAKNYGLGSFMADDAELHRKGINRLGNILVPNECYEYLETFMQETYQELYGETKLVSPSQIACRIGEKIGAKSRKADCSFLYWCTKNEIPVFCPGITDSAIGLQAYFFKQKRKDFGIDVTKDMDGLAQLALNADYSGGIVLGGGISKHHAMGVNLLRGGFDYAVYVTTSSPWDGSLSGARTNEGISWGKIKEKANHVTIDADATIAFPLLMAPFMRK